MKLLKKWFKKLQTNMGYTLVEVAAVVAITATLGAVVVPIAVDKTTEGKLAAARADTQAIGNAITTFYKDMGQWPAASLLSNTGTSTYYAALRTGTDYDFVLGTTNNHDPNLASTFASSSNGGAWTSLVTDHLNHHLVVDNPGGSQGGENGGYKDRKWNWKGPYSESFDKRDPWGNNYLVYVKAMYNATSGSTKEYGWIISAGPNAKLETGVKDNVLQGDDVGYAHYSADTGR